ncbi:MAG: glycoside hydrolase family 27 protein [Acidobacteriaceae bacterium]|nr:glycoside hydrolase family 27 protein [Acidobacteriaceae bacterium]
MKRCLVVIVFAVLSLDTFSQQGSELAPTPPMGWNSWDSYGLTVTEAEFKSNVDWLHQHLQKFGWQYVVVDEGWYLTRPENASKQGGDQGYVVSADGLYQPATNRFPSSANGQGMKPLADYVHSLGLKFGIHIIRGIPKQAVEKDLPIAGSTFRASEAADQSDLCRWNPDNYGVKDNAAGQAYYDSLARLYASWGLDFLKVDCISQPYDAHEIHMISAALKKSGRPIVLSLSPGPTPLDQAADVRQYAQMWRISDDMWDIWAKKPGDEAFPQSLKNQFGLVRAWSPYVEPGHWPDADMLPIGYLGPRPGWGEARQSRFTLGDTRTLLTFWAIARSPLILGTNLTRMDPQIEAMVTNPEVIAVDQHSTGNRPVSVTPETVIWTAFDGSNRLAAVFNLGDSPANITQLWTALGLDRSSYRVRDLWLREELGTQSQLRVSVPPHGAFLFSLR